MRPYLVVIVVAAATRVILAIGAAYIPSSYLQGDEAQYVQLGHAAATGTLRPDMWHVYAQSLYDTTAVFMVPITVLFRIFGTHDLVAAFWAVLWGVGAAGLTVNLTRRYLPRGWAVAAGLVVALMPSQVFWSSLILRESLVWCGLIGIAIGLAIAARTGAGRAVTTGFAICGASLWALGYLRGQVMVVAAWALVLAAFCFRPCRPLIVRSIAVIFAVLLPLAAGFGVLGLTLVHRASPQLGTVRANSALGAKSAFVPTTPNRLPTASPASTPGPRTTPTTAAHAKAGALAAASSAAPPTTVVNGNPEQIVVHNGLRSDARALASGSTAYFLRPYPWDHASDLSLKGAKVENILWYPLYVLAAVGIWSCRRERNVIAFPVLITLAAAAVDALTVGNLGTAFRHRAEVLWAVAFLAVLGGAHLANRWQRRPSVAVSP